MNKLRRVGWKRFSGGLFRRTQQENQQLVKRLALLRADYNQLKQDTDELLNRADREMDSLRKYFERCQ